MALRLPLVFRAASRRACVLLTIGLVATLCSDVVAINESKTINLAVDISGLMPMPARQLQTMIDEITALWEPHGISFTWITMAHRVERPDIVPRVEVVDDGCRRAESCLPGGGPGRPGARGPEHLGSV